MIDPNEFKESCESIDKVFPDPQLLDVEFINEEEDKELRSLKPIKARVVKPDNALVQMLSLTKANLARASKQLELTKERIKQYNKKIKSLEKFIEDYKKI